MTARYPSTRWRRRWEPSIWLAPILVFGGILGCGETPPKKSVNAPKHLILITVDTWRADHFLTSQVDVSLTPNLEDRSREGLIFIDASSPATVTSAGVAAILTGLLPRRSGVVINNHMLPSNLPTLASVLRESGFKTGAFVANPVLKDGFGFERGFDEYVFVPQSHPAWKGRGSEVNDALLRWLDAGDERLFLWAHYMEPHGPYEPPEEFLSLFEKETFDGPTEVALLPEGMQGGLNGIPHYQQQSRIIPFSNDSRDYLRRYAAEVRAVDEAIGKLLTALETRNILQDAVLIVTSDHGEALAGDHGFFFSHDHGLTQDQVAVPLLVVAPGLEPATVERPVSTVDIFPSVVSLLGIERGQFVIDGLDLLTSRENDVVGQTSREFSLRRGPWKIRVDRKTGARTLVNLEADPGELTDLSTEEPARFRSLSRVLSKVKGRPRLAQPLDRRQRQNSEDVERLKALGYL